MSAAGDLAGRVALVTGGGRGVGAACARALAESGADIALLDAPAPLATPPYPLTSESELRRTADAIRALGRRCLELPVDVRDQAAVRSAVAEVLGELGVVDLLVVSAGIRTAVGVEAMSDSEWDETVDVNLHGAYHALRAVIPTMVEKKFGRVLFIAGDEGRRGAPLLSHNAAAAWGVIGMAKSVAVETADHGIAINVVCTSPLDTTMFRTPQSWAQAARRGEATEEEAAHALRVRHPRSEAFPPIERVVDTALFLLRQRGEELTGSVVDVSMGLSALNSC